MFISFSKYGALGLYFFSNMGPAVFEVSVCIFAYLSVVFVKITNGSCGIVQVTVTLTCDFSRKRVAMRKSTISTAYASLFTLDPILNSLHSLHIM